MIRSSTGISVDASSSSWNLNTIGKQCKHWRFCHSSLNLILRLNSFAVIWMSFSLRSRVAKSSKVPESIAAFSTSHGGGELEKGRFNWPAALDVKPLKLVDKFSCYLLIRGYAHRASRASFCFLEWLRWKKSRQTFGVPTAQTSGLVNVFLAFRTVFHLFVLFYSQARVRVSIYW